MNEFLQTSDLSQRPKFCVRQLNLELILERLDAFGFKVVADLHELLGSGLQNESEIICNFFRYYQILGKSQKFIDWAINSEVERTECPSTLFRLESFATSLLYHRFLSSQGVKFLKGTVSPLIERVCAAGVERGQPSSINIDFIFCQTELLLAQLNDSKPLFPAELRLALYSLNKRIKRRFPDAKNTIPVLLFLRFICPSIIQPASFKIQPKALPLDVVDFLLPITRLLQCIANGQVENKILAGCDQEVNSFIMRHIADVQNFCNGLIAEEEIRVIKKTTSRGKFKSGDSVAPLKKVVSFLEKSTYSHITFASESWRKIPYLLKKRKLRTVDNKEVVFLDVLNSLRANVVLLLPDLFNILYYNRINQLQRISNELETLKIKPILIVKGSPEEVKLWRSNLGFEAEVFIDPSGRSLQLFHLEPRRVHQSNLNVQPLNLASPLRTRLDDSPKQFTAFWGPQNLQDGGAPMKRSNSTVIRSGTLKGSPKSGVSSLPPSIKMFVLYGDYIAFDSNFEGEIQELLTLLHACGSTASSIKRVRKRLKPGIFRKISR